jgi:hypothetical protein
MIDHTSLFLISTSSLSKSDESPLLPPSETVTAKVLSSVLVSTASLWDSSVVGHFHLADAFTSWGMTNQQQDKSYSLSFSAVMASASRIPAVAWVGHKH